MDKDLLENSEFKEEMLKYTFALNRLTSELEILLEELIILEFDSNALSALISPTSSSTI